MMSKIRIKCKYVGRKREIIIGGIPVLRHTVAKVRVDENTFNFLKKGEECGWIEILEDNYEAFCASRLRNTFNKGEDIAPPVMDSKPEPPQEEDREDISPEEDTPKLEEEPQVLPVSEEKKTKRKPRAKAKKETIES